MKGRVVVLGEIAGREAAALMLDGVLEDLILDPGEEAGPLPGAIYRGVADRPMKGQGGVFVRLGDGQMGFLREAGGIAPGQRLIVQIAGQAEPHKAPPVSLRTLFKGRLSIVTPMAPGINVSRRIRETAIRDGLTALAEEAMAGCDYGLILRSAAAEAGDDEVAAEIAELRGLAEAVMSDLDGAPELLVDAAGPQETAWREWSDPEPDEVIDRPGAFEGEGVLDAIDALTVPEVALPAGGSLVIEPTRALVAVDVNTGADTSLAAGLKANIAAARELPRQLRLRGLGGQVVIDFAPMPKKDRAALDQQLRAAFRGEAAETSLAGWTPLGNYELSRKRDRLPLADLLKE
ncbi:ribonuclease E/G [Frigidibacter sp. MR17.14]|uniref:ribonuclease E/G n=1 Tax=Frigidibacter sp. MR17.14 TaxID=3126509 RepID=UPI003012D692